MSTRLIIARHGNTFRAGETPTRVGKRTDLPLVETGKEQAHALGIHLKDHDLIPDRVYCSTLQRTQQTAKGAMSEMGIMRDIQTNSLFDEIDYGPDENKPEQDVIARIGAQAIDLWDKNATPPPGWHVDPNALIKGWRNFAKELTEQYTGQTILVVTSNGTARFAPYLTESFESFIKQHHIKLSTGAYAVMQFDKQKWSVFDWNIKPLTRVK